MTQPLYTNRLIHEKSPYLLQHAHNPVNWYPWGEEAFQLAKELDRPIFLSIGYATCHWCHVMERESFENLEVATLMNRVFINIKVDREELPDVDSLYMDFAQTIMAGVTGWPLNVILTPHLKPFFASTYLPAHSNHGLMGLTDLVQKISELWQSDERERIIAEAEEIIDLFEEEVQSVGEELPPLEEIEKTMDLLYQAADPVYGGIKGAPKFPIGYQYSFMLNYFKYSKDSRALYLVEKTLSMMLKGGIYDHLGGGFSRYSVDEKWLVPHFEKMLYDNAILSHTYLEAWKLTKKKLYRQACEATLDYILREMTHLEGGFYSAEDADSEGREGFFYTWTYDEIRNLLPESYETFCKFYGVTLEGNFEGRNILHTPFSLEEFAEKNQLDLSLLTEEILQSKKILWAERDKRPYPFKDDKILTSWNGLMIYSLVEASLSFNHAPYLEAAIKAARFIKKELIKEGYLFRRWRDNQASFKAGFDDYAFLIRGLISLFEANAGVEWLASAIELSEILEKEYQEQNGAFYQTDGQDPYLLIRKCQFSDGAEPSANAVHTQNLMRLHQITGEERYLNAAEDILKAAAGYIENYPMAYTFHVMNLLNYYNKKNPVLIIALNSEKQWENELKTLIFETYLPAKAVIWQYHDIELEELIPNIMHNTCIEEQTTLYICHAGYCEKPLVKWEEMQGAVKKL